MQANPMPVMLAHGFSSSASFASVPPPSQLELIITCPSQQSPPPPPPPLMGYHTHHPHPGAVAYQPQHQPQPQAVPGPRGVPPPQYLGSPQHGHQPGGLPAGYAAVPMYHAAQMQPGMQHGMQPQYQVGARALASYVTRRRVSGGCDHLSVCAHVAHEGLMKNMTLSLVCAVCISTAELQSELLSRR